MTSDDEPLLKSTQLFHGGRRRRPSATNLSSLRSNVPVSSSSQTRLLDAIEDEEEITPTTSTTTATLDNNFRQSSGEWSRKSGSRHKRYHSIESLLRPPTRDRKRLVSWTGMEPKTHPTAFEISGVLSKAHEELRKSHARYYKNGQFDDDIFRDQSPRMIYFNDPDRVRTDCKCRFSSNEIRTSRYTLLNFLPKNLFFQFQRVAYLYFLVIAALNQLPPLAVFGRTASLFPLLFVLSVTAIKDGYEDWRRHRSDTKENNREALVMQSGVFKMKKWKDIQVGEIVKICADDTIPCDMVLLGTSEPSGTAYIQTMNLDGESNLKTRYAWQETAKAVAEGTLVSGLIRCEQPNRNVYEFTANMELGELKFPLGQSNIILRGCQLKNTEWVIGVVVYTGQETKAMLNSAASPSKRSKLERCMNRETLWLSFLLFIMCSVVAVGMGLWLERHNEQLDTLPYYRKRYFNTGSNAGQIYKFYGIPMETLIAFLSSIIVFQIMIPISLYITMELVRLGQSYFMIGDKHMYDSSSDSKFQCRSLNINEDLGQIRYLFSDKTGTLTQNKMEFRTVSIYGKKYGVFPSTAEAFPCQSGEGVAGAPFLSRRWKLKSEVDVDFDLVELLYKDCTGIDKITAHEFFLTLAACNTVIPIVNQSAFVGSTSGVGVEENAIEIDYQGESPDEQAIVAAASAYGYTLFERTSGHIVLDINGKRLRLDVLGMHEFDSNRKRMSVVIRFPDNTVKLLVKGADSSMFSILAKPTIENDHVRRATQDHITEYSSLGLRTLVLGIRDLTDAQLEEWLQKYEDASTSLTDRSSKLRQTAAFIEQDLRLLGATGIDDKLQDGVPEAIESLRQAGIKVWVLTGDKQETAISIGLSCKLLTPDMQQIIINGASKEECKALLAEAKLKYLGSECLGDQSLKWRKDTSGYLKIPDEPQSKDTTSWSPEEEVLSSSSLAIIIDGSSLVHILEKDLENELFDLATSCRVVLCCRVAPLQKAGIVNLIKGRTTDLTLAIGDGANDVSMIQMADVGVGICGQEGRQAVMASDFAMGQFQFLKRLLLVHGHWNYHRVGYLILYNFYRNAVFVLMLFWYILCAAFSTTQALTDWSSVLYSLIYTSMPTIVVGVLDKDLNHKTLLQHPKLYGAGHRQESYSLKLFWITMLDTFWQSLVLFSIPVYTYMETSIDIWSLGSLWTIAVVILVNVHLAMDIHRWVILTHASVWGSILITFAGLAILDSIPQFPNYGTIFHLAKSPTYWLTIVLIIIVALLPRFLCKVVHQMFWASDIQIAREAEALRRWKKMMERKTDDCG